MNTRQQREDLHEQGMIAIPFELFDDQDLTDAAMRLALALAKWSWNDGCCSHTNEQIAAALGWSVRSVRRTLSALVNAGWIKVRYTDRGYRSIRIRWRRPKPGTLEPRIAAIGLWLTGEDKSGREPTDDFKEISPRPERSGPKLAT